MALGIGGQRLDPVMGYNFLITFVESSSLLATALAGIQNVVLGGFSECTGLESALQIEDYNEGGNNVGALRFPTRIAWTNIRLKRGAALSDDLYNWHYSFLQGTGKRRDGVITLQNDLQEPVKVWYFTRGLPVKWTGPALNAAQSQLAVEELEIAHEGLKLYSPGAALGAIIGGIAGSIFG
jgi:phage tail-like protein